MIWLMLTGCITELPEVDDPCAEWADPGLYKISVGDRTALVNVPATAGPRPSTWMLHGFGSSANTMRNVTRFDAVGEDSGYVAVFPQGVGSFLGFSKSWNADGCCPPALDKDSDDVAFLDELAAELEQRVCLEPDRIGVSGFSNGAMMALYWGCQSDVPSSILAVAGPLMTEECPASPKPMMIAHGLADDIVEFEGGVFMGDGLSEYPSSDETLAVFLERNECAATEPEVLEVGDARCEVYDCELRTTRCTLERWDHRWPGGIFTEDAGFNLTRQALLFQEDEEPRQLP